MSEINLKLKTYDELTFEISRLNTDKYLLEQKLQQKENIIKEVGKYIEKYDFITGYYEHNYDDVNDTYTHYTVKEELEEILDKGE